VIPAHARGTAGGTARATEGGTARATEGGTARATEGGTARATEGGAPEARHHSIAGPKPDASQHDTLRSLVPISESEIGSAFGAAFRSATVRFRKPTSSVAIRHRHRHPHRLRLRSRDTPGLGRQSTQEAPD